MPFQYIFLAALGLLSLSQMAILDWFARLAFDGAPEIGAGFSLLQAIAIAILMLAVNLAVFPRARDRLRGSGFPLRWSRVWILGAVAALASGALLAFSHLVIRAAEFALPIVDASAAQPALALSGGVAVVMGFGSVAWAASIGQRNVRVEEVSLPLPGIELGLEDLRIAHLTDLHIGPLLRAPQLREFVAMVNELAPDLIVITGDIFDLDPAYVDEGCRELGKLSAKHGVYAILGNHDVHVGADRIADGLAELTSIRLLRNEVERIAFPAGPLWIAGFEDPGKGWADKDSESPELEKLARAVPDDEPVLLLIHRPSFFRQAADLGFPLSLAGHTHGGQVALPMAPHTNVARLMSRWTRGEARIRDSVLYVNRGIGVAGLPLRLNCSREVALISLSGTRS